MTETTATQATIGRESQVDICPFPTPRSDDA